MIDDGHVIVIDDDQVTMIGDDLDGLIWWWNFCPSLTCIRGWTLKWRIGIEMEAHSRLELPQVFVLLFMSWNVKINYARPKQWENR